MTVLRRDFSVVALMPVHVLGVVVVRVHGLSINIWSGQCEGFSIWCLRRGALVTETRWGHETCSYGWEGIHGVLGCLESGGSD